MYNWKKARLGLWLLTADSCPILGRKNKAKSKLFKALL